MLRQSCWIWSMILRPSIEGGIVAKTSPEVLHFMETMYASMPDPIFEKAEGQVINGNP